MNELIVDFMVVNRLSWTRAARGCTTLGNNYTIPSDDCWHHVTLRHVARGCATSSSNAIGARSSLTNNIVRGKNIFELRKFSDGKVKGKSNQRLQVALQLSPLVDVRSRPLILHGFIDSNVANGPNHMHPIPRPRHILLERALCKLMDRPNTITVYVFFFLLYFG